MNVYFLLYKHSIDSPVEHVSAVWSPLYNIYVSRIEKVQNFFKKYISTRFHAVEQLIEYRFNLELYESAEYLLISF